MFQRVLKYIDQHFFTLVVLALAVAMAAIPFMMVFSEKPEEPKTTTEAVDGYKIVTYKTVEPGKTVDYLKSPLDRSDDVPKVPIEGLPDYTPVSNQVPPPAVIPSWSPSDTPPVPSAAPPSSSPSDVPPSSATQTQPEVRSGGITMTDVAVAGAIAYAASAYGEEKAKRQMAEKRYRDQLCGNGRSAGCYNPVGKSSAPVLSKKPETGASTIRLNKSSTLNRSGFKIRSVFRSRR